MPSVNGVNETDGINGHAKHQVNYDKYHKIFEAEGLPKDQAGWIKRAATVAKILADDATERDIAGESPFEEVKLLKYSGLTKIMGPTKYGGGGQDWTLGYRVIREVAQGDGSLGMLLGYHLLWSTTANVVGTDSQREELARVTTENCYFIGGAVNPRDDDLTVTQDGEHLIFNGKKHFNTGGVVSDLTILEGALTSTGQHMFTAVRTQQPGIIFGHDWNNIGMRLTESGSVRISDVRVPWADALGWSPKTKAPIPEVLEVPFATLLLPTIQLVFASFYLGIARGALGAAAEYTRTKTRAWPFGGDNKEAAIDEFYILERYGGWAAHLSAAEALADETARKVAGVYATHQAERSLTARERGELAEAVVAVKIVATDVALEITNGIFEVTGSKATSRAAGFQRFWNDARVHTLHDPVAYKRRELGRYFLTSEVPEVTWYT